MQKDKQERYLELLAGLRLMDDDFFSEALDEKIAPVEYILNTVLERDDIRVLRTEAQVEYKSAANRSIKLDRTLLDKGKDFEDLVDTYVIFITEHDRFGAGLPLYHVERRITELDDALFGDGAHIVYVNGQFRDLNHPVGRLMHDMNCTNAADILNPLLAQEVRYLKETEGGRTQMCRAFEEVARESAKEAEEKARIETKREMVRKLYALGQMSLETIAECTELPLDEVKALVEKKPA